jgi:RimJ/RimL family protein N-acetyltransferase
MNLQISTERLLLRSFRDADLDEFLAYRNDPEVARFQSWEGISRGTAAALLRQNTQASLGTPGQWQQIAIALNPDDRLIGDLGLFLRDDGSSAELGFTLAARHQGRGFAREAMAGLIDALFDRPELERLEAVTDTRNESAIALLVRLGFEILSTAEVVFKGIACQEHTYALSRVAWLAARHEPQRKRRPRIRFGKP